MNKQLVISAETRKWLTQLRQQDHNKMLLPWTIDQKRKTYSLDYAAVIAWLKIANNKKDAALLRQNRYTREALRSALLNDLQQYFIDQDNKNKTSAKKQTKWYNLFGLWCLGFAGTVFSICDGFYGITAILQLFPGVPILAFFVVGFAFSLLSVAVFYGFGLMEIASNLDIDLKYSHHILDIYVNQANAIKTLRKRIKTQFDDKNTHHQLTIAELIELQELVNTLKLRYQALDEVRKTFKTELNNPYLTAIKLLVAAAAGIIFFGEGFFAGQWLSTAILEVCGLSARVMASPVLLISIVIGLLAFAVYWFVERPGLENLVGSWFGCDKDKVEQFSDPDLVNKQKKKLDRLEREIASKLAVLKSSEDKKSPPNPQSKPSFQPTPSVTAKDFPMFARRRAFSYPCSQMTPERPTFWPR